MMIELKPCPFCGASAEVTQKGQSKLYKIVADHSEECVFRELAWYGGYETENEAIEAWKRRVDDGEIH